MTDQIQLSVQAELIDIAYLPADGLLPGPDAPGIRQHDDVYAYKYLPPKNLTEKTLLSMWVNTHQAMFMSTGIAASCVRQCKQLIEQDAEYEHINEWLSLAIDCRLASAAYTSLPHLTKELYEAYVRKSMMEVHPGFSGVSNREAITMELALRGIRAAHHDLATRNRPLAESLLPELDKLYQADKTWWRYHGKAMQKYVSDPTSLARMDFMKQKQEGSEDASFSDYRDRVLRQEDAVNDYDDYFAVTRSDDVSLSDYQQELLKALRKTDVYVESDGPLAEFRKQGETALFDAINRFREAGSA